MVFICGSNYKYLKITINLNTMKGEANNKYGFVLN